MTCNNQQKSSENLLNKRAQIFKNIRCELCVTCRRWTDFSRCLRHDAPTRTSTNTDSLIRYMCVCLCVYSYCDEPWKCHLLLHMAVFLGCWQGERVYGIGVETAVFQNTAGAVRPFYSPSFLLHTSHFLGHYACCTHSYINKWTIKKKSIMKPGTAEGIDIFNNWKWKVYEIRIFTASKPHEKLSVN